MSQLRRPQEAVDSFRSAISIAPQNSKAFYNFAVHYYSVGETERALEMAREALRIDPGHVQARDLVSRIEAELHVPASPEVPSAPPMAAPPMAGQESQFGPQPPYGQQPPFGQQQYGQPSPAQYYRPGYYDYSQPVHSLPFVERLGGFWDGAGWTLAGANFIYWVAHIVVYLPILSAIFNNAGGPMSRQMQGQMFGPYPWLQFLGFALDLGIILWMCLDLADRRGNWLWLLPTILSCCCVGLIWTIPPIYILFGRQRA